MSVNIAGLIGPVFGLIPGLVQLGKLSEAESALMTLSPLFGAGAITATSITALHRNQQLVPVTAAVASLGSIIDALLTANPDNLTHITDALTALGLPQK